MRFPTANGSGHQEHEPGEDVPQALLGGDADHDTGDRPAEEEVTDGNRQHGEHPDDCHGVAEARDQHAHGGTSGLTSAPAGQRVELHGTRAGTRHHEHQEDNGRYVEQGPTAEGVGVAGDNRGADDESDCSAASRSDGPPEPGAPDQDAGGLRHGDPLLGAQPH